MVRNLLIGGKMRLNRINYKPRWEALKDIYDDYCQGFARRENKDGGHMFNKEMDELMEIYECGMISIKEEIEEIMPMLTAYMEKFCHLNRDKEELNGRISDLQRKIEFHKQSEE